MFLCQLRHLLPSIPFPPLILAQRMRVVLVLLLFMSLGGCLGGSEPGQDDLLSNNVPRLATSPQDALASAAATTGTEPLRWLGQCTSACPVYQFQVSVPEGSDLNLEASVTWDYRPYGSIRHAYTSSLHRAGEAIQVASATDLYYSSVSLMKTAQSGSYELRIQAAPELSEDVPFEVVVQLETAPVPDASDDLLPNLGALVPAHLEIFDDLFVPLGPVLGSGCLAEEFVEQGSRRCLRFSSGFTNTGAGDLVAHLNDETNAQRQWIQVIQTANGEREVPAAPARFHPFHSHFHYEGALGATVYGYDLDTLSRGEAVNSGRKTGFCFEDWGLAQPGSLGTSAGGYKCLDGELPLPVEIVLATIEPRMGVSAGWYDLYGYYLADQYVDMAGVPDGVYELVNVADPDGTLVESDTSDNEASIVFRLTGNDVEILGTPAELRAS